MNHVYPILFCFTLVTMTLGQLTLRKPFSFNLKGYEVHMSSDLQDKNRQIKDAAFNGESSLSTFFETVQLSGTGSIYHPNLMFYSLSTGLGLNQNITTQSFAASRKTKSNNFFNDIAFQSIWLGAKPYNMLLGYNQKYRKQNSNFFDDSINRSMRWFIQGNWRTPEFRLNLDHGTNSREEEYGDRQIIIRETNSGLRGSWGTMESASGSANLTRSRVLREERNRFKSNILNTTFQASNSLPLKNKGKTVLYSSLYGNIISSEEDVTSVNLSNRANYEWSHTLRSDLSYYSRYNETQGQVGRSHTITANTGHQLYASLTTSLSFQKDYYIENQYQQNSTDFSGDWKYTKKLPKGRLLVDYAYKPHWENIHSENPLRRWVEDIFAFDAFGRIIIREYDIDVSTLEILDATGTTQYFFDLDFLVLVYDNRVEIQKTPTSSISDTTEVLIRYQWQARKNEGSYSVGKQFGLMYEFQSFWGINVGYKQSLMEYPEHVETTLTTEDNRSDRSYFLHVEYPPVKVTADYTKSNSSITPYERFDAGVNTVLGSFLTQYLSLNLQYGSEYLPLKHDRQTDVIMTIEAFRRLSRSLKVKAGFSQKQVDGKQNQLFEKRLHSVVKMENRRMSVTVSYEKFFSRFFNETETDQQWKIQLDIKS